MSLKRVTSLLAYPDGDDAVALLLQGYPAVVVPGGTRRSTHLSALGVVEPGIERASTKSQRQ
jgi:hypothetical protein